ncbi:pyrimidine dimer DNA glycosylase [Aestuariimicrobium soli]|uniref:pyrimidine dimer DNA glycosylase n=1 Tax=Aestuariimicrobium soli TaxID=2035834 RepID=UPI003EBB3715
MALERDHLQAKLLVRSPDVGPLPRRVDVHPLFRVVPGDVEPWERAQPVTDVTLPD